jgi:hypothetical protein
VAVAGVSLAAECLNDFGWVYHGFGWAYRGFGWAYRGFGWALGMSFFVNAQTNCLFD